MIDAILQKRAVRTVLVTVALIVGAGAAWWTLKMRDTSLNRVQEAGEIRIGYAVEAPYAFLGPDGTVTGESPEIARLVASRLGIPKVAWRQAEFASLITQLNSGRIDVIAAGMFITPERSARVAFSLPTFHVHPGLLVPKGNPRHFTSYQKLVATPDAKVAVLDGSTEEQALRRVGLTAPRLFKVPDALTGKAAVESGTADALALSSPTIRWMVLNSGSERTETAQPFEYGPNDPGGLGAFAFRKQDRHLLSAWNGVLASFIGTPRHLELISRFGFSRDDLPSSTTATQRGSR